MHIKTVAVRNCVQITLIPMEIPVAATLDTSWLLMGRTAAVRCYVKTLVITLKDDLHISFGFNILTTNQINNY